MKHLLLFGAALICAAITHAQTIVPAGNVTGPWTAAGSPYIVQGNITCGTLVIQAGVDVRFQNHSGLTAYTSVKAYGTAASPVIFESDDTTGWSNVNSGIGGTEGIYIYGNGTDTSYFDHIIFRDAKSVITDNYTVGIATYSGPFVLTNSEIYHNYVMGTSYIVSVNGGAPLIDNNNFHDNYGRQSTLALWDSRGLIQNNQFVRNRGGEGAGIYAVNTTTSAGPMITNNVFHHNRADYDGGAIYIAGSGWAHIVGNTIAYNHSLRAGSGIYDLYSPVEIRDNLVCNNSDSTNNPCGITDGGGGIMINGGGDTAIVQNNVVANNTCYFRGGGIRVSGSAYAFIENNNVINNNCYYGFFSGGLDISDNSHGSIRNNIFWGNRGHNQWGQTDSGQVYIGANDTFALEFNFAETSYVGTMIYNVNTQISGNQSSNVLMYNTNPGFIGATMGEGALYNATTADWHLVWASPLIDHGVTSTLAITPQSVDFYGDQRIAGNMIDIGAVEYPMENGIQETNVTAANVYPNPTADVIRIANCTTGSAISIADASGRIVESTTWNGDALDVSFLPAGIYCITIEQEGKVAQSKFVRY